MENLIINSHIFLEMSESETLSEASRFIRNLGFSFEGIPIFVQSSIKSPMRSSLGLGFPVCLKLPELLGVSESKKLHFQGSAPCGFENRLSELNQFLKLSLEL